MSLDASPASPQPVGTVVTLTATAAGCGSSEYRFWIITPNPPGVGLVVQGWNPQNTYTWNTRDYGSGTGTYGLRVDARHPGASDAGDATTSQDFVVNPVTADPACTSVTLASSRDTTSITYTATATGCQVPEFQWWVTDPNGVGLLMQSWSTTNTYSARLNGAPGNYTIKVEARQQGDTPVEATATATISVGASPSPTPSP